MIILVMVMVATISAIISIARDTRCGYSPIPKRISTISIGLALITLSFYEKTIIIALISAIIVELSFKIICKKEEKEKLQRELTINKNAKEGYCKFDYIVLPKFEYVGDVEIDKIYKIYNDLFDKLYQDDYCNHNTFADKLCDCKYVVRQNLETLKNNRKNHELIMMFHY